MPPRDLALASLGLLLAAGPAFAQEQYADPDFHAPVARPTYAQPGPVVAVDEGHANFHTIGGRYQPFAALLTADGYRVRPHAGPITAESLAGIDVLVIANARGTPDPAGSAFSDAENEAIRAWAARGGSVLLIADHAPFGSAAAALARSFGVDMGQGYVVTHGAGPRRVTSFIPFSGDRLGSHAILEGRDAGERVKHVLSFTGQSLSVPEGATGLLMLPDDAFEVRDAAAVRELEQGGQVSGRSAKGRAQAIALAFGRGRVVVLGEAAMLSAQILRSRSGKERIGMNAPRTDDLRFALNLLHWLSRLPGM